MKLDRHFQVNLYMLIFCTCLLRLNSVWVLFQNIVVPNTEEGRIETVIELQQPNTVLGLSQSTFIIVTCEYSQVFHFFCKEWNWLQ